MGGGPIRIDVPCRKRTEKHHKVQVLVRRIVLGLLDYVGSLVKVVPMGSLEKSPGKNGNE